MKYLLSEICDSWLITSYAIFHVKDLVSHMNMRHLENYWKLGKQIGVHFVLVFDVIRGKLSSIV